MDRDGFRPTQTVFKSLVEHEVVKSKGVAEDEFVVVQDIASFLVDLLVRKQERRSERDWSRMLVSRVATYAGC